MLQDQNTNDTTIQKPADSEVQDNTQNVAQDTSTNPSNVEADVAKPQVEEARPEQDAQVDPNASSGDSGSTPEDPEVIIKDLRAQLNAANAELGAMQEQLAALTVVGKATDQADSTDATVPDSASGDKTDSSISSLPESDSSINSETPAEAASAPPSPEMAAAGEASLLPVDGEV